MIIQKYLVDPWIENTLTIPEGSHFLGVTEVTNVDGEGIYVSVLVDSDSSVVIDHTIIAQRSEIHFYFDSVEFVGSLEVRGIEWFFFDKNPPERQG